jgi:hypothetical protein
MSTEINDGRDSGNNKFDDIVVFRGKDVWAIDGVCAGTAGNCSAGTATGDNGVTCGTRTWVCNGSGGGANASCTLAMGSCLVNGVCNNSVALGCTAGTAGSDNGLTGCGTTRTWVCNGSGGGTNSGTCSFANAACASVNGVCGGSPASCSAGTVSGDNGETACGTTRTWNCNGSGGGTNASCGYSYGECLTFAGMGPWSACFQVFIAVPCSVSHPWCSQRLEIWGSPSHGWYPSGYPEWTCGPPVCPC